YALSWPAIPFPSEEFSVPGIGAGGNCVEPFKTGKRCGYAAPNETRGSHGERKCVISSPFELPTVLLPYRLLSMNFGPWLLSRGGHLAACIFLRSRSTRKQSRQNPDHRRHLRLMNRLLTQMARILRSMRYRRSTKRSWKRLARAS